MKIISANNNQISNLNLSYTRISSISFSISSYLIFLLSLFFVSSSLSSVLSQQTPYIDANGKTYFLTEVYPLQPANSSTAPYTWPGRVGSQTPVTAAGNILIIGGLSLDPNTYIRTLYNDVYSSQNNGATFELVTRSAPFSPRVFHQAVLASQTSIMLIGGFDAGGAPLLDTYFTNDGLTWTSGSQMPWAIGRGGHALASDSTSNLIYVTGGMTSLNAPSCLNDAWKSADAGFTWQVTTVSAPFKPVAFHGSIVRQTSIFVVGGATQSRTSNYWTPVDDVWKSDDQGSSWVWLSSVPSGISGLAGRMFASTICYNNDRILVVGGLQVTRYDSSGTVTQSSVSINFVTPLVLTANTYTLNDVWESQDAGMSWIAQNANTQSPFSPRLSASLAIVGQTLVILTGSSGNNVSGVAYPNDVWVTTLPLVNNGSDGAAVAAIIGILSGILLIVVIVTRRLQGNFVDSGGQHVYISKKSAEQIMKEQEENEKL